MNLVLFTSQYPFEGSTEQTFLKEEIKYLAHEFEAVTIVPRHRSEKIVTLPENVDVDDSYTRFLKQPFKFFIISQLAFSPFLYREIFKRLSSLIHPRSFFRLIMFLSGAHLTRHWLLRWIQERNINVKQTTFYTYWFDQAAFGIGMAKHRHPDLKLVSRAHGYDLYEERYSPAYLPLRYEAFRMTDILFPDSEMGKKYLSERYPQFKAKFETSRLGVPALGFVTRASSDGVFRILSCSLLVPVKRVDLLLSGIAQAARLRPHQKIEWHHFGNGDARLNLQSQADAELPKNAQAFFPGYESNQALLNYYQDNPVDVFFNVSSSEGTPVAIMEAISCGIPIVATNVGGNREIVSKENGLLLSPNPSPDEIAQAIFDLVDHTDDASQKREGSLSLWRRQYYDKVNFESFIKRMKSIQGETETLL